MESLHFYKQYHSHPVNKTIHAFCIPMIVFSIFNLLTLIRFNFNIMNDRSMNKHINRNLATIFVKLFYFGYYYTYFSPTIALVMFTYFTFIKLLSMLFIYKNKNWFIDTVCIFTASWVLQFLGHYIEGSRPALTNSFVQAFLDAPVFSLEPYLPLLLKYV